MKVEWKKKIKYNGLYNNFAEYAIFGLVFLHKPMTKTK